jgi:hypothetical protein
MSWIGPTAKRSARLAVKYGPQAKIAWEKAGKPASAAATKQAQSQLQRRKAFAKAATVVDGAVLRVMHAGEPVWVVLAEGEPVEAFPSNELDVGTLTKGANLGKAVSSEEFEAKRLRARLDRARRRARRQGGEPRVTP